MEKKRWPLVSIVVVSVAATMLLAISARRWISAIPAAKLLVASEPAPGVSQGEILIGSSSALSGPTGQLGTDFSHGALARIASLNQDGGINGRKIRLIGYDDQYDPAKAVVNTQKLINDDRVFALLNYVGTPTAQKVLPMVTEAKIPLLGIFSGAQLLRNPVNPYVFNVRSSYYQEIEVAVARLVDRMGIRKVAVFYQADAYGMDGLEGARIALDKRGIKSMVEVNYVRGTTDVEKAADSVIKSGTEAVIMVGTYGPSAKFVKLVRQARPKTVFHSVSFVGPDAFAKELGDQIDNVYVTQVVPPPDDYDAELFDSVKDYREDLAKAFPNDQPSFGGLEGYINARILVEAIRRCGDNLTRDKLVASLEGIKDFAAGIGTSVNFSPTNHQGIDKVFFTQLTKDGFKIVLPGQSEQQR